MGAIDKIVDTYKAGSNQTDNLGKELAARQQMNNEAKKALGGGDSAPAAKPAPSGGGQVINPKAQYGDRPGEKRIDVTDMVKPLGSYKKGTPYVPKTGHYKLHEGEAVIPANQNAMGHLKDIMGGPDAEKKPKELKHVLSRKTKDGKVIHEHHFTHPEDHKMEEHVSEGNDQLAEHMMEHMGEPNPGEADADAGKSGIEE